MTLSSGVGCDSDQMLYLCDICVQIYKLDCDGFSSKRNRHLQMSKRFDSINESMDLFCRLLIAEKQAETLNLRLSS